VSSPIATYIATAQSLKLAAMLKLATMSRPAPPALPLVCLAELLGTFLLVLFGCGSVHTASLLGAQQGIWQVAVVWGVTIMLAIFAIGGISGAHINPAITLALAAWGRFGWGRVLPYIISQFLGAWAAAVVLFTLYGPFLQETEQAHSVDRGAPGSEITAMCYCEFYPNPSVRPTTLEFFREQNVAGLNAQVSTPVAFLAEALGTGILALVVFAVTDPRNAAAPQSRLAPVFIGLTVAVLISIIGPLTQACFNPARDFGPRAFAAMAGWGSIALPGIRGYGTYLVYLAAPITGALVGAGLYQVLLRRGQPVED
jgi:glycerol uptake facilitator protein